MFTRRKKTTTLNYLNLSNRDVSYDYTCKFLPVSCGYFFAIFGKVPLAFVVNTELDGNVHTTQHKMSELRLISSEE